MIKKYIKICTDFKIKLLETLITNKNFIFFITAFSLILSDNISDARPGGGHSYGGGGGSSHSSGGSSHRSSSSGGSGDGGILVEMIFRLIFAIWDLFGRLIGYQVRNILALIIVIVFCIMRFRNIKKIETEIVVVTSTKKTNLSLNKNIDTLKSKDPNFSKVLFLDFVNSLYQKFYNNYGKKEFSNIKPFLTDKFIANEVDNKGMSYSDVVIGSIDILKVNLDGEDNMNVQINANYTTLVNNSSIKYDVIERWNFVRKSNLLSKEPDVMRTLACPNCGAPGDFSDAGQCSYCGTVIVSGEMQWAVSSRAIIDKNQFHGVDAGGYVEETGTRLPSVIQNNLEDKINEFKQVNNISDWNLFLEDFKKNTMEKYFLALYGAWSNNDLRKVRGLLSDRLYESWNFWIDNYKKKKWTNKLSNIKINDLIVSNVDVDKFYEAVTLRVFASSFDYTEDSNGNVIGGSNNRPRQFSEYWTFIRSRSSKPKDSFNISSCPSCGNAADKINQSGICEYCGSKITNGDFSWVLTSIAQDEVYKG